MSVHDDDTLSSLPQGSLAATPPTLRATRPRGPTETGNQAGDVYPESHLFLPVWVIIQLKPRLHTFRHLNFPRPLPLSRFSPSIPRPALCLPSLVIKPWHQGSICGLVRISSRRRSPRFRTTVSALRRSDAPLPTYSCPRGHLFKMLKVVRCPVVSPPSGLFCREVKFHLPPVRAVLRSCFSTASGQLDHLQL